MHIILVSKSVAHALQLCGQTNRRMYYVPGTVYQHCVSALRRRDKNQATKLHYRRKVKEIEAVFFDFCKAFDSVPHQPLLTKLCQRGINPHIVQWIHNYLADRKQCVVVNGASSLPTSVVSGVPQGSILGPLLFLIYIDDIADVSLSDGSKIVLSMQTTFFYTAPSHYLWTLNSFREMSTP